MVHMVHVMNLTTQDQHELQLNRSAIPSPHFRFSHMFNLPLGHTVWLHACAAYLRKYSRVEEVQRTTRAHPSLNPCSALSHSHTTKQLETVIYTACR